MEKLLINKGATAEISATIIVHVRLEGETNNYDSKIRDSAFEIIDI